MRRSEGGGGGGDLRHRPAVVTFAHVSACTKMLFARLEGSHVSRKRPSNALTSANQNSSKLYAQHSWINDVEKETNEDARANSPGGRCDSLRTPGSCITACPSNITGFRLFY